MPPLILRGNSNPQLQAQTYTFDPSRGSTYAEHYKGTGLNQMIALYNNQAFNAQKASMKIGQGMAELTIEWGGVLGQGSANSLAVTIDRWESPEPKSNKDLLSHPALYNTITGLGCNLVQYQDVVSIIRQYASAAQSSQSSTSSYKTFSDALAKYFTDNNLGALSLNNNIPSFYHLYSNKQESYQYSQYAVRHTTNAPAYWSLNVADLNANRIYSPAAAMSEFTNSAYWYFPLPGRLQYKLALAVSNLTASVPSRYGFSIGWLKSAATEATVANGRIEIQNDYALDQWSTDIYGTPV